MSKIRKVAGFIFSARFGTGLVAGLGLLIAFQQFRKADEANELTRRAQDFDRQKWEAEQDDKKNDRQKHEQDEIPHLSLLPDSVFQRDGYTNLILRNRSPVTDAAITQVRFVIDDPKILREIEKKHPRPKPGEGQPVLSGVMVTDTLGFAQAIWTHRGYEFLVGTTLTIPAGKPNAFRLFIAHEIWKDMEFIGGVVFEYDDGMQCAIPRVRIKWRAPDKPPA